MLSLVLTRDSNNNFVQLVRQHKLFFMLIGSLMKHYQLIHDFLNMAPWREHDKESEFPDLEIIFSLSLTLPNPHEPCEFVLQAKTSQCNWSIQILLKAEKQGKESF